MTSSTDEYDAFVRARTPALLRSAYLLTGDQQLAEDLVQTALARTHRAWRRLHETGNAEAYARKIMYHAQISVWRRPRVAESLPGIVPERGDGWLDVGDRTAVRATLRQALLRLTPKQRAVLVLRFYEDRSEEETAALLGVTIGTVKSQTARALGRIRRVAPELGDLYVAGGTR
jgi:RNA polymerase sigma-70 factor (sigma-E family)